MYQFEIHAAPIPQQHCLGRGRIYTPKKIQDYVSKIQWQIKPFAPVKPLTCPIKLDITCFFVPPKATSGIRRKQMLNGVIHHITYPDASNCAYIIENALKKIVYEDDKQIIDNCCHKRWGERAMSVIKVIPIDDMQPTRGDACG